MRHFDEPEFILFAGFVLSILAIAAHGAAQIVFGG